MKDISLRVLGVLVFVVLLVVVLGVMLLAFGWRPTVGIGS